MTKKDQKEPTFLLPVTLDEALVLSELLQRYSQSDQLTIEDPAEQQALWNLCCIFEKYVSRNITVSSKEGYIELLERARKKLRSEP